MSLVRWDPFRELEDMSHRLNRVFSRESGANIASGNKEAMMVFDWAPVVDITETPEEFVITAELPQVNKDDVSVTIDNHVLTLKGERRQEKEEKGKKFHRVERSYGAFLRSFALPDGVDDKKLNAVYKDGVLQVHLPKSPVMKPQTISVKVS